MSRIPMHAVPYLLLVGIVVLVSCGGSKASNNGDTAGPGDQRSDVLSDAVGDTGYETFIEDECKCGPDEEDLPFVPDMADADASTPDADVTTDTLGQEMDRLFPGIRPECRPPSLGCGSFAECPLPGQRCVGGGCVLPVAPADYLFSGQIQRVRALVLPAGSTDSTFDFNGDGVPDNALADGVAMFNGGLELVNNTVAEYIGNGQYTYLVELRDVPEDGCGPVKLTLFAATSDTDQDGLPNNETDSAQVLWSNFRQDGYGPAGQFNVAAFDDGLMISGPGGSMIVPIVLPDGTAFAVPLEGLRMRANLELAPINGPTRNWKLRPLDTPGAPASANAEVGGYIQLRSFVDEMNLQAQDCACAGIDTGSPVAALLVEQDKVKVHCVQNPNSSSCPESQFGRSCANLAAACLALPVMSQLADVSSGQVKDSKGDPIPDSLSLALYVQISPGTLADPPLAPDFSAVDDTWRVNPICDLLQDGGPRQIGVLLNDFYDPNVDPVIISIGQISSGGTVAILESGNKVSYTPPAGYYGFDEFSYAIQDAQGNMSTAVVELRISPVVTYDPNLDCQSYCLRQCEQERVCQPDAYAADWGDPAQALCSQECGAHWCPLWPLASFCAQTQRMEVLCSSFLTCSQYETYLEAVTLAEAGLPLPETTPCGGVLLKRLNRCGTCEAGYYSPECQPCPGGAAAPCGDNATCEDGSGGDGSCVCKTGYTFVEGACVDLDECAQQPSPCGEHGICGNRVGSYVCGCESGYVFYDGTCAPVIDPCNPNPCSSMTYSPMHTCTLVPDSPKGYACDCMEAYPWDPVLGACRSLTDVCDPNLCSLDPWSDGSCWPAGQGDFMCQCIPMMEHFWSFAQHRCIDPCEGFDCSFDSNSMGYCITDSSIGTPMCACKQDYSWDFGLGLCRNWSMPCDPDICYLIDHALPGTCEVVDTYSATCQCEAGWTWNWDSRQCSPGS